MTLVFLLLLLAAMAEASTTVSADSITLHAADLPEFKTDPHATGSQGNQISGVVRGMLQDRQGNFWFATQNGVCRHDGISLVYFDLRDEFDHGVTATAVVEDREGDIWIGSTGGVTRFDGEFFTTFTEADGLNSKFVWSLFVDSAGVIWIGTYDGVSQFDGKAFLPFPIPASTRNDTVFGPTSPTVVWDITQDLAGNLWFAAEAGVYTYDGQTLSRVRVMEDESDTFVTRILCDRKGSIWFATRYKGMIRLDGGGFTNVTQQGGLRGTEPGCAFEDGAGNIWFPAEHAGVYRYDGASFTNFSEEEGLTSGAIHRVYQDQDGRIWCIGWEGVFRMDGKSFVNVTRDGPW